MTTPADRAAIDLEATRIVNSLRILATTVELEAKKWEHTDTMNEIVQLALARDSEGVRANVAEACVVELAGALAFYADHKNYIDPHNMAWVPEITYDGGEKARAVLSATPAEAMERANLGKELITASDAVIDSGRRMRSDPGSHEFALANLCAVMGRLAELDTSKA